MDKNMTLEKRIAAELYCYQGKMSVFVDDLQGHTVEVGADEEFETASTIKAFILATLYLQAQRGKADLAEEITYEQSQFVDGSGMLRALGVGAKLKVKDTATMMIICSDNVATNMIIDYLGLDTINACIRELGFAHTVLHNPLHFDRYRQLGTTTPRDYAALFARIAKGELVSREASAEMLSILRQQHYNTQTINPDALGHSEGERVENLVQVMDGYFDQGAHHLNVNVFGKEKLLDAMEHPEKEEYANFTIRVSGYAVKFIDLTREQQLDVLARTCHGVL